MVSSVSKALLAILSLALLLSGCGGHVAPVSERSLNSPRTAPSSTSSSSRQVSAARLPASGYYRVRRGDTLYSIAWRYRLDFRALARANNIGSDYRIYPGQQIRLTTKVKPVASAPVRTTTASSQPRTQTKPRTTVSAPSGPVKWRWPATGRVIQGFSSGGKVNKGLNIAGNSGDPVYSAAPGVVVYAGNGLLGYGNLIIINHNETFLSAYAHNRRLLVKEQQQVKSGQKIAEIGNSGADRTMLHFEIRKEGKPVDPARYLPRR